MFKRLLPAVFFSSGILLTAIASDDSGTNGDPLFRLISAKHSKITFNNKIKDTKEANIMIYSNFYGGAGVGLGDINNDNLLDIYFAGNQVADKLYLNKGNLVFEDITEKAGILDNGGWSSGVLFGDVNQDGWPDIYVTRELYDEAPELRKNKLYINQGDNTFKEQSAKYNLDDNQRTRHATFLDYDRDGDLDIFLCNQPPNAGDYSSFKASELIKYEYRVRLMEYDQGTYKDVTKTAGLDKTGFPNSVTASDLNGDGWTDLYVANDFWVGDWYFINNGDGTFSDKIQEKLRHTSFSSMGVDAGDINNDGKLDMMIVDMVAEDNYRLKANMGGMDPDEFWRVVNEGGHYQYMFNTLNLNMGDGHFSDIAQLGNVANTDWSWSPLFADLDNDGWKDIFIANGLMRDIRNKDASKKFREYVESKLYAFVQNNPNPGNASLWDVVDINKTLKIVPSQKLKNYAYRNKGDLTFENMTASWGFEEETFSHGAAFGDLDNDGDLDLVISNVNDPAFIYENHAGQRPGHNFLRIHPIAETDQVNQHGTKIWIETEHGEQYFEITGVRGMYSTSEMIAHFGIGNLPSVRSVKIRWMDGKEQIINNCQANQTIKVRYREALLPARKTSPVHKPILKKVTAQTGLKHRHQENNFDDYMTQVLLPHKMSTFGPALATGDVNQDGLDDFYIGGAAKKSGSVYLQRKNGTFELKENEVFAKHKVSEDVGAAFFDIENDGDFDLYVVSGGNEFNPRSASYQDRLYINNGNGQFTDGSDLIPEMIFSGSVVVPEDFDQDGDVDLFIAGRHQPWNYPEPASSYLLVNNSGTFANATPFLAPDLKDVGMVNDAIWMDYDQDGRKDLLIVGEWMAPTFFKNNRDGFQKITDIEAFNQNIGWWFSVNSADMDGDGDQDIIAGNLGLNYKYKASQNEPFEVYYYDFDGNQKKDIVLTYYNFGIKYPLRGRQCSSEQIPMLAEKFKTYDVFANADVEEVYGEDKLEHALHYEATSFASSYFENLGNGQFKSHPLPTLAQISSIHAILIHDFNTDGNHDLLLAGNLYHVEVETARNDAGCGILLLGDGKGKFEVVDRDQSGFFVPYDVKHMALLRSPDQKKILVAPNDHFLQIYQNNP